MEKVAKPDGLVIIHDLYMAGLNRKAIADTLYNEYSVPHVTGYRWLRHYFDSDEHVGAIKKLRNNLGNSLLVIFNRNFEQGNRSHDRVAMEAFDRLLNLFPTLRQEEVKKVEPITVKLVGYTDEPTDS